jgi:DNA-binding MarR family transcriptional regulator
MSAESELPPNMREALEAQRAIFQAIKGLATSTDWLSLDLSMGQLKALMTISGRHGMTVSEIAETLGASKPSASMLVDALTHRDYVTRHEDANDRRRTVVTPTDAGLELVTRLRQTGGEQAMLRWIRQLAPDDLAAYGRGMRALAAVIAREAAQVELGAFPASAPTPHENRETGTVRGH